MWNQSYTYCSCLTSQGTARRGPWSGGLIPTWIRALTLVDIVALFRACALRGVLCLLLIPCCYTARDCSRVDARFLNVVETAEKGRAM